MTRKVLSAIVIGALSFLVSSCAQAEGDGSPTDRSKVIISLERTECFGPCPIYSVTISGTGHVLFTAEAPDGEDAGRQFRSRMDPPYVLYPGRHEAQIDAAAVDRLLARFSAARFSNFKEEYRAEITDHPTYVLSLRTGSGTKRVVDYAGLEAGMPKVMRELEDAVDEAAGTDRWIRGSASLIPWLEARKFDFKSDAAAELAVYGQEEADSSTIATLIDRGVPLEMGFGDGNRQVGLLLMEGAIRHGQNDVFERLAQRGWLQRLGLEQAGHAFAAGVAGCNAAFVDVAADAGIDLNAVKVRTPGRPKDDDKFAGYGETALAGLGGTYDCLDETSRIATAKRLLARGADPNRRDEEGETAIFEVENIHLLDLLLASGADAQALDKEGNSAVFGSWTDNVVLRLLEAGASPKGRYYDGRTLKQQMKERPMPKVQRWLAEHPDAL